MADQDKYDDQNKKLWSNLMSAEKDTSSSAPVEKERLVDDTKSIELDERRTSVMAPPDVDMVDPADLPVDEQYTWDVVFVFDVGKDDKKITVFDEETQSKIKITQADHFKSVTADYVNRLEDAGLKTDLFLSVQKDEVYVRVGASEKRLQQEADRIDYDLQLDHERCLEAGKVLEIRLAAATDDPSVDDLDEGAWFNLYGKYDQLDPEHIYRQELYKRYNDEELGMRPNSLFTSIDRIKLTIGIIEADYPLGGAQISMTKGCANDDDPMLAFYPLHEMRKKKVLMERWFQWRSTFSGPLDEIRSYFGEQIALYFAFLEFYNKALIFPAVVGFIFFIWQLGEWKIDVGGLPAFAIFVSLWATLYLEAWKRKESRFRVRWGMTKFAEKEQPRPEFEGEWRPSPIDGHKIEYFPFVDRVIRALVGQTVIWSLIGVVLGSVIAIFLFRKIAGTILTAIINALQIQLLNYIYGEVAYKLNDYENHRTDTEYENALIAKTFLFKFVNSYNSLFYIAFFKKNDETVGGCKNDNCLAELAQQLGTIFLTAIVVNNAIEIGVPMLTNYMAARENRQEAADGDGGFVEETQPEKEYVLAEYESTFDDYDELVVQYGYVTLFVVAFPIAPVLALLNNVLETRVDAHKLCVITRRPEPRGAYDIGTWADILNIVSFIAVMINTAIIAFETDLIADKYSEITQAYIFIAAEHIILLIKFAIAYFVPDEPEDVINHKARQQYIVNVLINGMEDPTDDEEEMAAKGPSAVKVDFDWEDRLAPTLRHTGREWKALEDEKSDS